LYVPVQLQNHLVIHVVDTHLVQPHSVPAKTYCLTPVLKENEFSHIFLLSYIKYVLLIRYTRHLSY
jgi:hypothetical protein